MALEALGLCRYSLMLYYLNLILKYSDTKLSEKKTPQKNGESIKFEGGGGASVAAPAAVSSHFALGCHCYAKLGWHRN